MPAKKKSTKKKSTTRRRRSPVAKRTTRRRSSSMTKMGMTIKPLDIALAIGGALAAEFVADNATISKQLKDPKLRYGLLAAAGAFAAYKGPKELRPAFVGFAIGAGVKAAVVLFPKLMPPGKGGLPGKGGTIGRLTAGEQAEVERAVQYRMEQDASGTWTMPNGRFSPVTGQRGGYSPVTGPARAGGWNGMRRSWMSR